MDRVTFGKFIAATRRELGMTQQALADQLHVTNTAVSKWERGLCYPDLMLLENLAVALGLTVEELMACKKRRENGDPADAGRTDMSSLLEIAGESQRRQKKKIWPLAGLLALSFVLLMGAVFLFAACNMGGSGCVSFVGKKANTEGNFVYVETDGRLLRLRCPDQQVYDSIEVNQEQTYRVEYSWNYFTYEGTLKNCQEMNDGLLGTPMDEKGSAFIIDSLLGTGRVTQSIENVYPDPERDGKYLHTYRFYYQRGGEDAPQTDILTVESCRSVVLEDYDEDGITELFVLTKYAQEPYMLYDIENGVISAVFVDEVPEGVQQQLKMGALD